MNHSRHRCTPSLKVPEAKVMYYKFNLITLNLLYSMFSLYCTLRQLPFVRLNHVKLYDMNNLIPTKTKNKCIDGAYIYTNDI